MYSCLSCMLRRPTPDSNNLWALACPSTMCTHRSERRLPLATRGVGGYGWVRWTRRDTATREMGTQESSATFATTVGGGPPTPSPAGGEDRVRAGSSHRMIRTRGPELPVRAQRIVHDAGEGMPDGSSSAAARRSKAAIRLSRISCALSTTTGSSSATSLATAVVAADSVCSAISGAVVGAVLAAAIASAR